MKIPYDLAGYSVNLSTGTVHTRYPGEHAREVRKARSAQAVASLLGDRIPKVCRTCYPGPGTNPYVPPTGQVRRNVETLPDMRATHPQEVLPTPPVREEQGKR